MKISELIEHLHAEKHNKPDRDIRNIHIYKDEIQIDYFHSKQDVINHIEFLKKSLNERMKKYKDNETRYNIYKLYVYQLYSLKKVCSSDGFPVIHKALHNAYYKKNKFHQLYKRENKHHVV